MHGHLYLYFNAAAVGIDEANAPPDATDELERWKAIVAKSSLAHLRAALHTDAVGLVAPRKAGGVVARIELILDIREGQLSGEWDYDRLNPRRVELDCWTSTDSARKRNKTGGLTTGMWKDGLVGILVSREPTKDDPTRMLICISTTSMCEARQTLLRVLTGESRPAKPWII